MQALSLPPRLLLSYIFLDYILILLDLLLNYLKAPHLEFECLSPILVRPNTLQPIRLLSEFLSDPQRVYSAALKYEFLILQIFVRTVDDHFNFAIKLLGNRHELRYKLKQVLFRLLYLVFNDGASRFLFFEMPVFSLRHANEASEHFVRDFEPIHCIKYIYQGHTC